MAPLSPPEEARALLARHGVTVAEWARTQGFKASVVAALLSGRTQGNWGGAHEVAIALVLKVPPEFDEEHPLAGTPLQPQHVAKEIVSP